MVFWTLQKVFPVVIIENKQKMIIFITEENMELKRCFPIKVRSVDEIIKCERTLNEY